MTTTQNGTQTAFADVLLINAKIITLDANGSIVSALAILDGLVLATGTDKEMQQYRGPDTKVIDGNQRTIIPGLNDSHIHLIRGGLSFNMELRWDGLTSLADGMRMLKEQALRTPPPQWVRIVGGWTEQQFHERRMPTLDEINEAAPDTPVFLLHLYDRALLNRAALRAVGYTKDTPDPPGGKIERDRHGNPTGLLLANPNATLLYATLAKGPKLPLEDQINSSRQFMRELNRLGVTSIIDAGGGFHYYPEDYQVIEQLHREDKLTVRIAYNLFTQHPKAEVKDFQTWTSQIKYGSGDAFYRPNGAGEMLVFSSSDFEDFLVARPDLSGDMEQELEAVVRVLAEHKWPFRLHATYEESITRALNVFEKVNRDIPFDGIHWFFDHAETISDRSIDRVSTLGGGIAIQHRMAFQGEYFVDRYGPKAAERTPPIKRMLEAGLPVGAGTDATRVASYNPFVALFWMIAGRTIGGLTLYPPENQLSRQQALRLYTQGSSWFSNEQGKKGTLESGSFADLAVLSADYLRISEEEIKSLESVLTIVGGKIVYASQEFRPLGPDDLPISPDWSPVKFYGGYQVGSHQASLPQAVHRQCLGHDSKSMAFPFGLGCDCFAF